MIEVPGYSIAIARSPLCLMMEYLAPVHCDLLALTRVHASSVQVIHSALAGRLATKAISIHPCYSLSLVVYTRNNYNSGHLL